ncbi:hypothetical protein [Caldalkalibacillus uzonensis]|uniref:hypothetical protein n=1 Tax=Caldalkalibacillus uzonensis TaxID=353224 RepID=UPI0027D83BDC|nr:hypothetical protein [Caldalkalibacillus uzonensis]
MSKKSRQGNNKSEKDPIITSDQSYQEELQSLQKRMNELMEQNEKLRKEMQTIKDSNHR